MTHILRLKLVVVIVQGVQCDKCTQLLQFHGETHMTSIMRSFVPSHIWLFNRILLSFVTYILKVSNRSVKAMTEALI